MRHRKPMYQAVMSSWKGTQCNNQSVINQSQINLNLLILWGLCYHTQFVWYQSASTWDIRVGTILFTHCLWYSNSGVMTIHTAFKMYSKSGDSSDMKIQTFCIFYQSMDITKHTFRIYYQSGDITKHTFRILYQSGDITKHMLIIICQSGGHY